MGWKNTLDSKIDPSGIKQHFLPFQLKVHCCRYWKLNEWEYTNMSFPFWRLYYNTIEGASVHYKNKTVHLNGNKVVLIPPHTSFSTSLKRSNIERISGNRIESAKEVSMLQNFGMVDHLFIHFNLGFQFDHYTPGIYEFDVDELLKDELDIIRFSIISNYREIDYEQSLSIYSLIIKLVKKLSPSWREVNTSDTRIIKVIEYIENNYQNNLSNEHLAGLVLLAPNSFLRLFKQSLGSTVQRYIQQVRINHAILDLHNSETTIDEIAQRCGFSDRHHFSKVFNRYVGIPPARFRLQKVYR